MPLIWVSFVIIYQSFFPDGSDSWMEHGQHTYGEAIKEKTESDVK